MTWSNGNLNLMRHLAYRYDMLGPTTPRHDADNPTCRAHLKWMLVVALKTRNPDAALRLPFVLGALIAKGMVTPAQIENFRETRFRLTLKNHIGPSLRLYKLLGGEHA